MLLHNLFSALEVSSSLKKMNTFFIFAFYLFCYFSQAHAAESHDHFLLVQTWPPTFCSEPENDCQLSPLPARFTIHGLWSVDESGNTLSRSGNEDLSEMIWRRTELYENLTRCWPNLHAELDWRRRQFSFWNHEWNKHGGCQESLDSLLYFERAIKLSESLDLLKLLEDNGVTRGGFYQLSQFQDAIETKLRRDAYAIRCINWPTQNGQLFLEEIQLLKEIYVCCDKYASEWISCRPGELENIDRTCGRGNISFPATVQQHEGGSDL